MEEDKNILETIFWIGVVIFVFGFLFCSFIDSIWSIPQAAENANQYCKDKGYDFYESFQRIGLLSDNPIAIVCKYVDQYRKIDVRTVNASG